MISRLTTLFAGEAADALPLLGATLLALILANSALGPSVTALLHAPLGPKTVEHWVNDGLMVLFFVLVGMEIKREVVQGELSNPATLALPVAGALGGIVLPAAIYLAFTHRDPVAVHGWAIPSATDIAFAVAVLSALGRRVPLALKLFLLTLAIVDDLVAILIIALFYTSQLSALALGLAAVCLVALVALNLAGVRRLWIFGLIGIALWVCVLESGVHATLAGVALAFCLPLKGDSAPFLALEHRLKPWISFLVMPVFAFANSGLDLAGVTKEMVTHPVTLGVAVGLFFGKQCGVFGAVWLLIRLGGARLPKGISWSQAWGVSVCAGIGFTMSLFIGTLAFTGAGFETMVRLGVLTASVLSAALGYIVLRAVSSAPPKQTAGL